MRYVRVVTVISCVLDRYVPLPQVGTKPTSVSSDHELNREFKVQLNVGPNRWLDLLLVKKSNLEGAGYGVFALMDFEKGDIIGIYYGDLKPIKKEHNNYSEYSLRFEWKCKRRKAVELVADALNSSLSELIDKRDRKPLYFGIHLVNDPYFNKAGRARRGQPTPNILLDDKLQAVAIRNIKKGEEILLDYLFDDDPDVVQTR